MIKIPVNCTNSFIPILAAAMLVVSCVTPDCPKADYNVIPSPEVRLRSGAFILRSGLTVGYPEGNQAMERNAAFLAGYVAELTGIDLEEATDSGDINLVVDSRKLGNPEAYSIRVTRRGVTVSGGSPAGVFYGIQTLRKSLPIGAADEVALTCGTLHAEPRFSHRGVLFDTARHFFTVEFLKQYLDVMALHGCNRFHWHLTDDQGWRFEVKSLPLLTEVGSIRKETQVGNNRYEVKYDGEPHGGFYTQEECRELVAYAAERNIEIIPEIDLPGHMQAALAAYPELGCTGGPYEVRTRWGVSDEVLCVGNPKTLEFLKTVLDEVMDVFPSTTIHIGGDECPRTRWHDCPRCQAKAAELGFVDGEHPKEAYLQTYLMKEVEKYLADHGRTIIGWDEMLEGEPSQGSTIMAWRAVRSGADAAKAGHPVIMTPLRYCYIDYDQVSPATETAPSGVLPIRLMYDFEPILSGLSKDEAALITGTQANEWTEFIATEKRAMELLLPRLAAMAEVQWLQPERKDYFRFSADLQRLKGLYDKMGWEYYAGVDEKVNLVSKVSGRGYSVSAGVLDGSPIRYTVDGSDPTLESPLYSSPVKVDAPMTLKMASERDSSMSAVTEMRYHISKSTFKPVALLDQPALVHSHDGESMLTDGVKGQQDFRSGYWLGFEEKDVVATIDMEKPVEISSLSFSACIYTALWLFNPVSVEISASQDGESFEPVAAETYPEYTEHHYEVADYELSFSPVSARYFRVKIECPKVLPPYHNGRSHALYLFVDEISLD